MREATGICCLSSNTEITSRQLDHAYKISSKQHHLHHPRRPYAAEVHGVKASIEENESVRALVQDSSFSSQNPSRSCGDHEIAIHLWIIGYLFVFTTDLILTTTMQCNYCVVYCMAWNEPLTDNINAFHCSDLWSFNQDTSLTSPEAWHSLLPWSSSTDLYWQAAVSTNVIQIKAWRCLSAIQTFLNGVSSSPAQSRGTSTVQIILCFINHRLIEDSKRKYKEVTTTEWE